MGTRNIYHSIVEQVPDGVYIISRGKFSYVNEAFERLTRVSRKDLPAPIFDYLDSIHPADREVLRKRRETAKSGKGPPARFQIRVISEDGTVRHLEFNTAPLSDLPDTVLGIIRDVTEAKTKEGRPQASGKAFPGRHRGSRRADRDHSGQLHQIRQSGASQIVRFLPEAACRQALSGLRRS